MSSEKPSKQALVLSGGGADGAYAVGVLKALFSGRAKVTQGMPLHPDIFSGTSIGAFNAAFLVSQWDEYGTAAVAHLEKLWLERLASSPDNCGNGVFRFRGNPAGVMQPSCYRGDPTRPWTRLVEDGLNVGWEGIQRLVHAAKDSEEPLVQRAMSFMALTPFVSTEPMHRMLREEIDYRAIRRSSRQLRMVTTNWGTGQMRVLSNIDMTDETGPLAIAASAAIPGFFPPVYVGSQPFVDGSVLMNTPLKPAIKDGADVLHVIYMDPEVKNIPLAQVENFPQAYYRMQQVGWANNVNDDISDADAINRGLIAIRKHRIGAAGDITDDEVDGFFDAADVLAERRYKTRRPLRLLTIHRYNPRDPLSGGIGLLDFSRRRIKKLIRRGYEDTINHHFDGDVIPGPDPAATAPPDGDVASESQITIQQNTRDANQET